MENNSSFFVKGSFTKIKKLRLKSVISFVLFLWSFIVINIEFNFYVDELLDIYAENTFTPSSLDLAFFYCKYFVGALPFVFIPFILFFVFISLWSSKLDITISNENIAGKNAWGKSFSLSPDCINNVKNSGINGICITTTEGQKHKISFIDNRDEICLAMKNIGINIDENLSPVDISIISSSLNIKMHKRYKALMFAFYFIACSFLSISLKRYCEISNWYSKDSYSSFMGYRINIPYSKAYTYFDEMITTYIAFAFLVLLLVLIVSYLIKSNNQLSVSDTKIRGVNGFGKVSVIPINQINRAFSKAADNSVTISSSGKKKKYYLLSNSNQLAEAINTARVKESDKQPQINLNVAVEKANVASYADEIKKFKELLDMGAITQEEFDEKKKQLLGL